MACWFSQAGELRLTHTSILVLSWFSAGVSAIPAVYVITGAFR